MMYIAHQGENIQGGHWTDIRFMTHEEFVDNLGIFWQRYAKHSWRSWEKYKNGCHQIPDKEFPGFMLGDAHNISLPGPPTFQNIQPRIKMAGWDGCWIVGHWHYEVSTIHTTLGMSQSEIVIPPGETDGWIFWKEGAVGSEGLKHVPVGPGLQVTKDGGITGWVEGQQQFLFPAFQKPWLFALHELPCGVVLARGILNHLLTIHDYNPLTILLRKDKQGDVRHRADEIRRTLLFIGKNL